MSDPEPFVVVRFRWRVLSLATIGERGRLLTIGAADRLPLVSLTWSPGRLTTSFPRLRQRR